MNSLSILVSFHHSLPLSILRNLWERDGCSPHEVNKVEKFLAVAHSLPALYTSYRNFYVTVVHGDEAQTNLDVLTTIDGYTHKTPSNITSSYKTSSYQTPCYRTSMIKYVHYYQTKDDVVDEMRVLLTKRSIT